MQKSFCPQGAGGGAAFLYIVRGTQEENSPDEKVGSPSVPKAVCLRSRGAAVLRGGYIMPWCRRDRFEAAPFPKRTFPMFLTAFTAAIKAGKASPAASGWGWPSQRKWRKSWAGRFRLPVRRKQAPCFRSSSACKKREPVISHKQKAPELLQRSGRGTLLYPKRADIQRKSPRTGNPGVVCPMRFERTTFRVGV